MSEKIPHEFGVAMIRLRKPVSYYKEKYGTSFYGLDKLYLIMEKEHNRGQEGAGIACLSLSAPAGSEYIFRHRAEGPDSIKEVFASAGAEIEEARRLSVDPLPFCGEVYMGHLRYSTTGRSGLSYVHPFLRRNNWKARNMLLCGNFNLTNVDELFDAIVDQGQHPRLMADTFLLLEQLGPALDSENERLYKQFTGQGLAGRSLTEAISAGIEPERLLRRCSPIWDGGYVVCGIIGNGDCWAMRDPAGIRPAFYYVDDEVVVIASERPVIQTAFRLDVDDVKELQPGTAIIVDTKGNPRIEQILPAAEPKKCSFERIYFSRGSDADIYLERKALGFELVPGVLRAIGPDLDNAVFSFIPNTAEVAYIGLVEGMRRRLGEMKTEAIMKLAASGQLTEANVRAVVSHPVRTEKIALKDIKMRTFIAEGSSRDDMAAHVYDITYGTIRPGRDTLVVIDDSIVRGTTLRRSIIRILDRLHPRKIVIVSSSPQVRYPDCYGIDMSRLGEFIAFRAAMQLLHERGLWNVAEDVYRRCRLQESLPKEQMVNYVKEIYAPFSEEEISAKIAEMLTPEDTVAEVEIVYQTLEGMHRAIPGCTGDWYFSGNYPTPGGVRAVNRAFINFYEGNTDKR